ncbi:MAG: replicative DNA helicase [Planctomycetes bacterium]|nr:replicative DNA helicase [Planctomycetota bacterium]
MSGNGIERVPPHSEEAERAFLASVFLDNQALGLVAGRLRPDDFYFQKHALIYEAMRALVERSRPIDLVTVREELLRDRKYDELGGRDFLMGVVETVSSAENALHYAEVVMEKALLRRLIVEAHGIVADCHAQTDTAKDLMDRAQARIFEATSRVVASRVSTLAEALQGALDFFYKHSGDGYHGVSSQYTKLNQLTNGLHPGNLVILAARPRVGKTALALNLLFHIAVHEKKPCVFFSLEMSALEIVVRLIAIAREIDADLLRRYHLQDQNVISRLHEANEMLRGANAFIDDSSSLTLHDLRARMRRLRARHDLQVAFVDYLSLVTPDDRGRNDNRQEQVARMSRGLKGIARELDITVVCLAQLNRDIERRGGRAGDAEPRLADLRESGAIEQDADVVMLLHRRAPGDGGEVTEEQQREAKLIVAKQRNGPTGVVPLLFRGEYYRFDNRAIDDQFVSQA